MTPAQFAATYNPTAQLVGQGTGIDNVVLLAQWANETAWGTVVVGNNLGNIRCSPTTFCRYATLDDFATACIATFHNGFYNAVLSATTAEDQLAALVASPWSSNHYGGTLHPFYDPLEAYEMTPAQDAALTEALAGVRDLNGALFYPTTDPTYGNFAKLFEAKLKAAAANPPPATVDFTPVLNAIAQVQTALTALQTAVTAIKAKTDKDLA
jgi:hypothetical protein